MHYWAGYLTIYLKKLIALKKLTALKKMTASTGSLACIRLHCSFKLLLNSLLFLGISIPNIQASTTTQQTKHLSTDYDQIISKLKRYSLQRNMNALNDAYITFHYNGIQYQFHFAKPEFNPPPKDGYFGYLNKRHSNFAQEATLSIATDGRITNQDNQNTLIKITSSHTHNQSDFFVIDENNAIAFHDVLDPDSRDRELVINLFIHNDLTEAGITINDIKRDYLYWWAEHMNEINRQNHYQLFRKLIICFHNNSTIQSLNYQAINNASKSIKRFFLLVNQLRGITSSQQLRARTDRHQKFFLLTLNLLENRDFRVGGTAFTKGAYGIASLGGYQHIAHELGHTLGATHENASIQYNGWWCESISYPYRNELRSNCYSYSASNQENIAQYLKFKTI